MIYFEGMYGMGDTIYQRPFLRYFPGSYICTPWPELYVGLDVRCVRSNTSLRTQLKNEQRSGYPFYLPPPNVTRRRIVYGPNELAHGSIIQAFRRQFGVTA
ncbi:hypothetical protein M2756_004910, partial [Salmonella enterica]|nr:hypothetical protein [Salmonella enterica]